MHVDKTSHTTQIQFRDIIVDDIIIIAYSQWKLQKDIMSIWYYLEEHIWSHINDKTLKRYRF